MEYIARIVLVGVGATAVLDVWTLVLKYLNIPTMNFAFLGRWIGHLFQGTVAHHAIGKAEPLEHELLIGWVAHYAIGVGFAGLLIFVCGMEWARAPTLIPALLIGIATVAAPLFIMQPAMGSGFASSKTPAPVFNCVKSLINHTVFGLGLYLAAWVIAAVWQAPM